LLGYSYQRRAAITLSNAIQPVVVAPLEPTLHIGPFVPGDLPSRALPPPTIGHLDPVSNSHISEPPIPTFLLAHQVNALPSPVLMKKPQMVRAEPLLLPVKSTETPLRGGFLCAKCSQSKVTRKYHCGACHHLIDTHKKPSGEHVCLLDPATHQPFECSSLKMCPTNTEVQSIQEKKQAEKKN